MSDFRTIRYTDPSIGTYIRRYREALDAGNTVAVSSLLESYHLMSPSLHRYHAEPIIDADALNYVAARLPPQIYEVQEVIMGTSVADFQVAGLDILSWKKVKSANRRRLTYLHPEFTKLACLINSDSDIDDIVNNLVAYQIEHRKINQILGTKTADFINNPNCQLFGITQDCSSFLNTVFGDDWAEYIKSTSRQLDFQIKLLSRSEEKYLQNCQSWWRDVSNRSFLLEFSKIPVYFVSSNSHSLVNIVGGFLHQKQNYIFDYIAQHQPDLYQQWFESKTRHNVTRVNDFIYYVSHKFLVENPEFTAEKKAYELHLGIKTIKTSDLFPTDVQIIPVSCLANSPHPDANLSLRQPEIISASKALIINIQYPLGIAAYYLLSRLLNYFENMKGIYIIGKAAILDGNIGDIQIPGAVFDEVSNNIYNFDNLFNHYFPFDSFISSIRTNQKAVCVYGTFLENKSQLENYISTGMNIVEMENGNYLSALLEKFPLDGKKAGVGNVYNLPTLPLDLGIINYASDNPFVQNLGQESINFRGIESTYLATLTTLQRIIDLEVGVK